MTKNFIRGFISTYRITAERKAVIKPLNEIARNIPRNKMMRREAALL
jgi:hypothetical protein